MDRKTLVIAITAILLGLWAAALPARATPPVPGDTSSGSVQATPNPSSGGTGAGTFTLTDSGSFGGSNSAVLAASMALVGSIVAPNHIEDLGVVVVDADADVPCAGCSQAFAQGDMEYTYYLGLSGPGGVLVPVEVSVTGQHDVVGGGDVAGTGFSAVCEPVCGGFALQSEVPPYGNPTSGFFSVTDTVFLDPDTDLLRVEMQAYATANRVGMGLATADASVGDVDFIVSPSFPNRNAYAFVLPEPGQKALHLAGTLALLGLARRRRRLG